jgi:DNA primase
MFSQQLQQYIQIGMVEVNGHDKKATILTPPRSNKMAEDDWQQILQVATELREELEQLGYTINIES